MAGEILAPFNRSTINVDLATRRFRKQILRPGTFNYTDSTGKQRKLKFDEGYFREIKDAFDNQAFDAVEFQLADRTNSHDVAPERTRGVLVGLSEPSAEEGLIGEFEVSEDMAKLLELHPKLGVSARIFENLEHADGRKFSAAMKQVLGTTDPVITGLKPWEKVDLSRDSVTGTIDLSEQEQEDMTGPADTDTKITMQLTAAEQAKLRAFLSEMDGEEELAKLFATDPNGDEGNDDADEDSSEGDQTDDATAQQLVALSRQHQATQQQVIDLQRQLRGKEIDAEIAEFGRQGLAPVLLDLARPLLLADESQVVELSRAGGKVTKGSVGAQVRQILTTVVELSRTGLLSVDLDSEIGVAHGTDAAAGERSAFVDAWEREYPE